MLRAHEGPGHAAHMQQAHQLRLHFLLAFEQHAGEFLHRGMAGTRSGQA